MNQPPLISPSLEERIELAALKAQAEISEIAAKSREYFNRSCGQRLRRARERLSTYVEKPE